MKTRVPVPGSERRMLPTAKIVGKIDPRKEIEITVLVRPRSAGRVGGVHRMDPMELGARLPGQRRYLSREEFGALRGADPQDLAKVDAFAQEHNLTVVRASIPERTVKLAGALADLMAAFRPQLKRYRIAKRTFRGRTGGLSVPKELAGIVVGVFGFDNRPVAQPHYRRLDRMPGARNRGGARTLPRNAANGSFTPVQVARLYNFPTGVDGKDQCIALIELNDFDESGKITGTGFSRTDLRTYFANLKVPMPQVTAIGVDGGANRPGRDPNADAEVMLDIEVAGAVAPGSKIAVYFAPNTDQGFLDAINAALHDNVRKPSVISISWGAPEHVWTAQSLNAFNQAMQDAAVLGVSICCACGDNGSADLPLTDEQGRRLRDGRPHVDFPAASPFALACGGTRLEGSGRTIRSEVVWNEGDRGGAGGGGVSNVFGRPAYQASFKIPASPKGTRGRGVPDVAGDADPFTGYQVRVGGQNAVIGGTSAVAPLWAGLLACINESLVSQGKSPVGFINPLLYQSPSLLRDIVQGNNDIDGTLHKYKAGSGWDACTGLGTPDGAKLMQALGG
jgi:kumamolisin